MPWATKKDDPHAYVDVTRDLDTARLHLYDLESCMGAYMMEATRLGTDQRDESVSVGNRHAVRMSSKRLAQNHPDSENAEMDIPSRPRALPRTPPSP
jgi:hypothetical protein